MKLTMLGTGNAVVTKCYNTCFALEEGKECFLVDAGGGNTILVRLNEAGIDWRRVRDMFVTHKHIDHILGMIWMIRMITQNMSRGNYSGEARIYTHREVAELLLYLAQSTLQKKQTNCIQVQTLTEYQAAKDRDARTCLRLIVVEDGQSCNVMGHEVTFFDIHSTKAQQFGFMMKLDDGGKLTCCGDEPYNEYEESYAKGSKWLMHEAFCLYGQADEFKPYEKHHSTAKDAAELAAKLGVENLILYHTEDQNIADRKALYAAEGKQYFDGNVYVPEDLEMLEL